jgi:hypothetical protein
VWIELQIQGSSFRPQKHRVYLPKRDERPLHTILRSLCFLLGIKGGGAVTIEKQKDEQIYRNICQNTRTWRILPPATPPFNSSTSEPGLFTSKDLMTIICGGDVKSLTGTGIFLTMYSQTASMLYLS